MYICDMNYESLSLYALSNHQIAIDLGERFRKYRSQLRLTRRDISEQTGVSVITITRFENGGGSSICLNNLIALFRAIQRLESIAELLPDIPDSLYGRKLK